MADNVALTAWLNELAQNPYIRKDPIFLSFVTNEDFDVNSEQQLNSMSYHNPEVRVCFRFHTLPFNIHDHCMLTLVEEEEGGCE